MAITINNITGITLARIFEFARLAVELVGTPSSKNEFGVTWLSSGDSVESGVGVVAGSDVLSLVIVGSIVGSGWPGRVGLSSWR